MKKGLLVLLFCHFCCVICIGQDFQVYSVKGEILLKNGDEEKAIVPGMVLKPTSILTISAEARLIVLYETNRELYIIKNPTTDRLGNLIKNEGNSTQSLTESYLAFIKKKITESDNSRDKDYKQTAATSYRGADSLLLKVLNLDQITDTTTTHNISR